MADILLYNTLAASKQPFRPLKGSQVGLYVCGITPYDETHVGHARCYVVFDVLKRVLERNGYTVNHIQNYTDIDDKIIERAKKLKISPETLAEKNIKSYEKAMAVLNVSPARHYPRVTQSIPEIIDLIKKLVERGMAYEVGGSVYYSVRQFPHYGSLSRRKVDELEEGARVEVDPNKKDPLDFALWKKAKEGEPKWPSPWGEGRPGWHIECSVMSIKNLGEEFDIHGGGQDLIFPHHENEIAQSVGATEKQFARFWVHNGFVTINKEKMSKSLGNFFTLSEVLAQIDPMVLRYFLISQHYKSPLNFSDQELKAHQAVWTQRIVGAIRVAHQWSQKSKGQKDLDKKTEGKVKGIHQQFDEALRNDLNTPAALGELNKMVTLVFEMEKKKPDQISPKGWAQLRYVMQDMHHVLGLVVPLDEEWTPEILALVQKRQEARKNKNWAQSDQIRDELKSKGVVVEDSPAGPRLKRIS